MVGQGVAIMEQDVLQDYLSMQGYSTKTKVVIVSAMRQERSMADLERKVQRIAEAIDRTNQKQASKGRGLWQAVWHGLGVIKAEGDKIFKE
jgi:hypothetical protein